MNYIFLSEVNFSRNTSKVHNEFYIYFYFTFCMLHFTTAFSNTMQLFFFATIWRVKIPIVETFGFKLSFEICQIYCINSIECYLSKTFFASLMGKNEASE